MKQTFSLTFIPPTVNTMIPTVNGRRVKSETYKAWRATAAWEIKAQRPLVFEGPVSVTIEMKRPNRPCDVDNRIKGALDVLSGLAYRDDAQVHRVTAGWAGGLDGARITIETMG